MKIHSIFESISGEAGPVIPQGAWTTFIRTQGCNLQCTYCDTEEARSLNKSGYDMLIYEILRSCHTKNVLVTGGEPLYQSETNDLLMALALAGHKVQVETNGSLTLPDNVSGIGWAVDIKCPSSGMQSYMPEPGRLMSNIMKKWYVDLKFVISDMTDVDFALEYIDNLSYYFDGSFIFSPVDANGKMIKKIKGVIADFDKAILDRTIFSLQLHKISKMP